MHERLGIPPPPEANLQSRPFIKKRLNFQITEKQTLMQEAYDHAAHVHSLRQTLANSRSRVTQIKAQVAKDRQGFRQLMALRKKYTLSKFDKDSFLGYTGDAAKRQMPSLQLESLFVINMDFVDVKAASSDEQQKVLENVMSFQQSPQIQLMKKVIVRMVNNSLQLNFHPSLSALARSKSLNVAVSLSLTRQNEAA